MNPTGPPPVHKLISLMSLCVGLTVYVQILLLLAQMGLPLAAFCPQLRPRHGGRRAVCVVHWSWLETVHGNVVQCNLVRTKVNSVDLVRLADHQDHHNYGRVRGSRIACLDRDADGRIKTWVQLPRVWVIHRPDQTRPDQINWR